LVCTTVHPLNALNRYVSEGLVIAALLSACIVSTRAAVVFGLLMVEFANVPLPDGRV
jgi:hypothetical protein